VRNGATASAERVPALAGGEQPVGDLAPERMAAYIAKGTEALRKIIEPLKLNFD
jgi:hypothetical protein